MAPLQHFIHHPTLRLPRTTSRIILLARRSRQPIPRFYAQQSYGGGEGDPKGEDPQSQGSSPATSNAEHPGPPPPDVGKGTGGGATKKGDQGHSGSDTAGSQEGGVKSGMSEGSDSKNAAQPKIHKHNAPHPDEHSDEVKKHNEGLANRHERPYERSKDKEDKVDKGFWKGE